MRVVARKPSTENTRARKHNSGHVHLKSPQSNSQTPILQQKLNCPCGGGCPRCQDKTSIKAKLRIGATNDRYEQEANRVADQVMRMPEPQSQESDQVSGQTHTPQIQRSCPGCKEKEEEDVLQTKPLVSQILPLDQRKVEPDEEEEMPIQNKEVPGQKSRTPLHLQAQLNAMRGSGRPMSDSERTFFEPRFGHDFSNVRLHTDAHAAETARSVNARAFTRGRNIVLGTGQYDPEAPAGKMLLAHELTHVIQQSSVIAKPNFIQRYPFACRTGIDCPKRGDTEKAVSDKFPHILYRKGQYIFFIATFNVDSALLKKNVSIQSDFGKTVGKKDGNLKQNLNDILQFWPKVPFEVIGYSDCLEAQSTKGKLREDRAKNVLNSLPQKIQRRGKSRGAPINECAENYPERKFRHLSRSAVIQMLIKTSEFVTEKKSPVPSLLSGRVFGEAKATKASANATLKALGLLKKVKQIKPPTWDYNCHGYVFTNGKRWIGENSSEIHSILKENNYCKIMGGGPKNCQLAKPIVGDLVIYRNQGKISHSGKVTKVSGGTVKEIIGKWGAAGLYKHAPDDVPKGKDGYGKWEIYYRAIYDKVGDKYIPVRGKKRRNHLLKRITRRRKQ